MTPRVAQWARQVGLSLLAALVAGALAYVLARGITSVALFVEQQQFYRAVAGTLSGGIGGLGPRVADELDAAPAPAPGDLPATTPAAPQPNLRELRRALDARAAEYAALSLQLAFLVAAAAGVGTYLWLERRGG